MEEQRIDRRKNRLLTVLLSFLVPGTGHIYVRRYSRGLLLFAGLVLTIAAMIRLADIDGGRHLLLIVYLGLLMPIFYFYSVYDSLQSFDRLADSSGDQPAYISFAQGIMVVSIGILLLILIKPPAILIPTISALAELSVGPLIIVVAAVLIIRAWKGSIAMFKLGRITFAMTIVVVGALLLWDQLQDRNDIALLGHWWPVVFILLGIEIVVYSMLFRQAAQRLRFDAVGGLIALVISAAAYTVTQYADFPARWLDQFNVDLSGIMEFSEEQGFRYEKAVIKLPLDEELSYIEIMNPNGNVAVRSDDVQEIELYTTVWVDLEDEQEANAIAEQSQVKVTPGAEAMFEAKGKGYGSHGSRKPRMNMEIIVPISLSDQWAADNSASADELEEPQMELSPELGQEEDYRQAVHWKLDLGNGDVQISGIAAKSGLEVKSGSGVVVVQNVNGPISIQGNNGNIELDSVIGETSLETKNGSIIVGSAQGSLYANTLNGSIQLKEIVGNIEADTKNGKISIFGASAAVKADTLNGNIIVESSVIGGNWDLDSTIGEITVSVPETGHYSIYGSVTFGNVVTDLPLEESRKTIRGIIGEGTYRIQINATNSIAIRRAQL